MCTRYARRQYSEIVPPANVGLLLEEGPSTLMRHFVPRNDALNTIASVVAWVLLAVQCISLSESLHHMTTKTISAFLVCRDMTSYSRHSRAQFTLQKPPLQQSMWRCQLWCFSACLCV